MQSFCYLRFMVILGFESKIKWAISSCRQKMLPEKLTSLGLGDVGNWSVVSAEEKLRLQSTNTPEWEFLEMV